VRRGARGVYACRRAAMGVAERVWTYNCRETPSMSTGAHWCAHSPFSRTARLMGARHARQRTVRYFHDNQQYVTARVRCATAMAALEEACAGQTP